MKKVLGIVLLVLAVSLVSVPAFAQKAELSLKYWHAGVGGADLWVGDYQVGEFVGDVGATSAGIQQLNGGSPVDYYTFDTEKLVLQPSVGPGFILSGSYFLSPSTSVGISYWGLNRTDTVGVEFINEYYSDDEYDDDNDVHYWLRVPWWDESFSFMEEFYDWDWDRLDGKGVLTCEGNLSMSALDISGTKTLAGPDWELALSGGIRRAVLNQHQLTALELSTEGEEEGYDYGWDEYYEYYTSSILNLGLDSKLSISAVGPQAGIEGGYALADKLILNIGARAGFLFGTAVSDAVWKVDYMGHDEDYYYSDDPEDGETYDYEWREMVKMPYSAKDAVRITTYDLNASLGYQITEQLSVEAGYYASLWKGIPSLSFYNYNDSPYHDLLGSEESAWEQPAARDIVVSGLTFGVNFKF